MKSIKKYEITRNGVFIELEGKGGIACFITRTDLKQLLEILEGLTSSEVVFTDKYVQNRNKKVY